MSPPDIAPKASSLLTASLLILSAVDVVGGQGDADDDAFIWEESQVRLRPIITWEDIARLRAAVAAELAPKPFRLQLVK